MIVYRPMTAGDIPAGLSLCRAAGWNQISRDWELFLQLSPEGCRVAMAEDEMKVVGTATTVQYEDHFSWIGMVLVDPDRHRQGIGSQLLRESLQVLKDVETVKLDATPAGRQVYLQLDFVDEYEISRMALKNISPATLPDSTARPIRADDLPALLAFDKKVFGANRLPVLEWLLAGGSAYAFLLENHEGIRGYCFGRPGHNFTHIGPVVSHDPEAARELVSAALRHCSGPAVVLDALLHTREWMQWLLSIGFQEQRPLIRMYRGTNAHPGIPEKQFAILGPEFG